MPLCAYQRSSLPVPPHEPPPRPFPPTRLMVESIVCAASETMQVLPAEVRAVLQATSRERVAWASPWKRWTTRSRCRWNRLRRRRAGRDRHASSARTARATVIGSRNVRAEGRGRAVTLLALGVLAMAACVPGALTLGAGDASTGSDGPSALSDGGAEVGPGTTERREQRERLTAPGYGRRRRGRLRRRRLHLRPLLSRAVGPRRGRLHGAHVGPAGYGTPSDVIIDPSDLGPSTCACGPCSITQPSCTSGTFQLTYGSGVCDAGAGGFPENAARASPAASPSPQRVADRRVGSIRGKLHGAPRCLGSFARRQRGQGLLLHGGARHGMRQQRGLAPAVASPFVMCIQRPGAQACPLGTRRRTRRGPASPPAALHARAACRRHARGRSPSMATPRARRRRCPTERRRVPLHARRAIGRVVSLRGAADERGVLRPVDVQRLEPLRARDGVLPVTARAQSRRLVAVAIVWPVIALLGLAPGRASASGPDDADGRERQRTALYAEGVALANAGRWDDR